LVTPEVVAPLDPCETPPCLPGMHSDVPNDCQMYWKGYIEVPSKGPCGPCGGPGGPDGGAMMNGTMGPGYEEIGPGTSGSSAPTGEKSSRAAPPPTNNPTKKPGGRDTRSSRPAVTNAANRNNPSNVQSPRSASSTNGSGSGPGLVGPVGYDVLN